MEKLLIGKVLRPRGLKGELKIQILTNRAEVFSSEHLTFRTKTGESELKVTKASFAGGFAYLFIDQITTVEAADRFRNAKIYVDRANFPLDEDELLDADLIGFKIIDETGKTIGNIEEVRDNGGSVFLISGEQTIPYEDEFIIETNTTKRQIVARLQ